MPTPEEKITQVKKEIAQTLNKHGLDAFYQTPDYILAEYVMDSLIALHHATKATKLHHGEN